MHRLVFAILLLAPQESAPREKSAWNFKTGSWVRLKSSGVSDGEKWAVETKQTVLAVGEKTVTIKMETIENGETKEDEMEIGHQMELDLDLEGLAADGKEDLDVDGTKLACTIESRSWVEEGRTYTLRVWKSKDAPTLSSVVRYELGEARGKFVLELVKLKEEVEIGKAKVDCYVIRETDDRDGKLAAKVWYSAQVPGRLVRIEEKYEGEDRTDTYESTVLEFSVAK